MAFIRPCIGPRRRRNKAIAPYIFFLRHGHRVPRSHPAWFLLHGGHAERRALRASNGIRVAGHPMVMYRITVPKEIEKSKMMCVGSATKSRDADYSSVCKGPANRSRPAR